MYYPATVEELRSLAKKRLPQMVFDFVDGGAGMENALQRNILALRSVCLTPRVATGAVTSDISTSLFGMHYQAPFGVAPMGLCNLVGQGADSAIALAANASGIPYINGTTSTTMIEAITEIVGRPPWFQLYGSPDENTMNALVERAKAAGCPVLVVTLDMPVPGFRPRDFKNKLSVPLQWSSFSILPLFTRLGWLWDQFRGEPLRFANLEPHLSVTSGNQTLSQIMALQTRGKLDWKVIAHLRECWTGKFVLKGVLDSRDADRAVSLGVDGIIVSNHGGRQLDSAPAPAEVIKEIRLTVGEKLLVLMDGGIRSGEDIVKAIALGADFVFLGRPFLYAYAALGTAGPSHLINLLVDDIKRTIALLGLETANRKLLAQQIKIRKWG